MGSNSNKVQDIVMDFVIKQLHLTFYGRKTILGACLCTWEIEHVKEQTCTLLDHKLFLKNFSSAPVYTPQSNITYLKTVKY